MLARYRLKSYAAAAAILLAAGFAAGYTGVLGSSQPMRYEAPAAFSAQYVPSYSRPTGRELVLVYLGSLRCRPSNDPGLPAALEQIKIGLQQAASENGYAAFAAVGVAVDWSVLDGLRHLARYGPFDEIAAGRNWLNTLGLRYVWQDMAGPVATPQLVVLERDVSSPGGASLNGLSDTTPYAIRNERLLLRKVGLQEIERWFAQGLPLPATETY